MEVGYSEAAEGNCDVWTLWKCYGCWPFLWTAGAARAILWHLQIRRQPTATSPIGRAVRRPKDFDSRPDSGVTLLVLRRIAAREEKAVAPLSKPAAPALNGPSGTTPAEPKTQPAVRSVPIPPELRKPIIGKNYLILPLYNKTELQRHFTWDFADAKLFIVINGRALLNDTDTQLNTAEFDYSGFLEALYKYKEAGVRGHTIVTIEGVPRLEPQDWKSYVAYQNAKHPLRASQAAVGFAEA